MSSAKTPAEPHERKKGSKKNKKGSARSSSSGSRITFDEGTLKSLREKVKKQNEKASKPWQRVSLSTLKAVYRRGAGAFSTSHRPNQNRSSWSMGRVNAFLKIVNGRGNPKFTQDNDLLSSSHPRRKKVKKGFPNMPFRVAGQGARRELIDPRNFPPARPIPLYPKPRVNSASQITEDMPISTQQHVEISRIAQHEANFDAASSRIRQVLTGADPFMLSVIMNRLRVFFQVSKALGEDTTSYGRGSNDMIGELTRLGQQIASKRKASKEEKEKYERERKKYIDKHSRATKGYETPSATRQRAVETWFKTADETDTTQEAASARAYLKKKEIEPSGDASDVGTALNAGWKPSSGSLLGDFIQTHQQLQAKQNERMMEVAVVNRKEIIERLKKDRQQEIDHAFGLLPADTLNKYPDLNPSKADDREEILLREGYDPVSADHRSISESTSPEQLLGMSSAQGLFDGKAGRTHRYEGIKNAENWREDTYPDVPSSENVSSSPNGRSSSSSQSETSGDASESGDQSSSDLPENVIAIGPRGGHIVAYRNGRPVYRRGGGSQGKLRQPPPAEATPEPASRSNEYRPVQRRSPVNTDPLNTPQSLDKALQVAEVFCKSLGMNVDKGRLLKSEDERILESLDDTYERLVHIRPLLDPHHTSMHNEIVHRLREAHANPSEARAKQAIEMCEHFIESVLTENERKIGHAKEMLGNKKEKVTKAIVRIKDGDVLVKHPARRALGRLAKSIDAAEHEVYEHNLTSDPSRRIDLKAVRKCFVRSSSLDEARARVRQLILLAKGDESESFDADLLCKSHPLRLAAMSVEDLVGSDLDPDIILEHFAKGVRIDEDGEDADHDDDDFEEDQEQLEEEVSEGINPEGDDEEEDDEEAEKSLADAFGGSK